MHEDIVKYAWRNFIHAKKKFNIIYTKKLNKYVQNYIKNIESIYINVNKNKWKIWKKNLWYWMSTVYNVVVK